jgi:DnaJ family protein C protein 7
MCVDLNPNEPSFYTNRAFSSIQLKEFKRAIEDCERAIALNISFGRAYKRLFKCYLSLGDFEVE